MGARVCKADEGELERVQPPPVCKEPSVVTFIDGRCVRGSRTLTLLCALAGLWLGLATAHAAAGGGYCDDGERVEMSDPVVTLVEGPGDPAVEQALWEVRHVVFDAGVLEVGRDAVILEKGEP